MGNKIVRHIVLDGMFLALMAAGAVGIHVSELTVSLQLLFVFAYGALLFDWYDGLLITGCYFLLGLFLPIYAGYSSGLSATFGFVIGFIPGIVLEILIKNLFGKKESRWQRLLGVLLGELLATLVVYLFGAVFMYFYFSLYLGVSKSVSYILGLCVIPYIPFDIAKMALSAIIFLTLENPLRRYFGKPVFQRIKKEG